MIMLEVIDDDGRSSISDVTIYVEPTSSEDRDKTSDLLPISAFFSILIITLIIFLIMIRKKAKKSGPKNIKVKSKSKVRTKNLKMKIIKKRK
jgi:hypothetical protein